MSPATESAALTGDLLLQHKLAWREQKQTAGRPVERWYATAQPKSKWGLFRFSRLIQHFWGLGMIVLAKANGAYFV